MAKEDNEQEIVTSCAQWIGFSIDQTSVEDLDRRLKLAIAHWAGIRCFVFHIATKLATSTAETLRCLTDRKTIQHRTFITVALILI